MSKENEYVFVEVDLMMGFVVLFFAGLCLGGWINGFSHTPPQDPAFLVGIIFGVVTGPVLLTRGIVFRERRKG
jgi:hypothetical protein